MRLPNSIVTLTTLVFAASAWQTLAGQTVDFNRDVRPILASKCFACHGPDESHRQADLRLDDRQVALDYGAIVPGAPEESELISRVLSEDPDERMPPLEANDSLSDEQTKLLERWVAEGAEYARHWAFVPPIRPPVPQSRDARWPRTTIDHFILARLKAEGLRPSPEADRHVLIRRVYLDLIGLPPSPAEADAFLSDNDPKAYEKVVDRLLKSKRYGERWARHWLDLARYADTNGYEKDRDRSIWPYRDWVIRALNADMPFDQFTIEQLAGDMLDSPSENQRVATGFHRNTMLNEEGGIDPLEYRFYSMVDRVATTGTVWLGLTIGCAQCHTHKYDPISHTDYYRFMALLDNADEPDLVLKQPAVSRRREEIQQRIEQMELELPSKFPPLAGDGPIEERCRDNYEASFEKWLASAQADAVDWKALRPIGLTTNLPKLEVLEDGSIFSSGDITKRDLFTLTFELADDVTPVTAIRLEVLPDDRLPAGGPGRAYYEGRKGDFFLSELSAVFDGGAVGLNSASHSYGKIAVGSGDAPAANVLDGDGSTGWSTAQREGEPHQLVVNLERAIERPGTLEIQMLFERHFAASLGRFRFSAASADEPVTAKDLPVELETVLARPRAAMTPEERGVLSRHYRRVAPELADARKAIEDLRSQLPAFPITMVMQERRSDNPRLTHRHHRGEYLSPREGVSPGIPAVFATPPAWQPSNRLTLASWLVSDANPLVGRVTVNRAWQAFFGTGLVRTSGDFGTQAAPPTHPELLDWLAVEFVEQGWSLKRLHRLIVTSSTYRQCSSIAPALLRRDPANELLARGPRHRVNAEIVRDTMLQSSGLLSPKMYGASVYPPQPESVAALAYGNQRWTPSKGEDRYRRSLYTFSKRTAPFAAYTVFDAPSGESCVARRDRSNTPLQALTLLNDEMYLEMARALAQSVMEESASDPDIATSIFRRLLTRLPQPAELDAILRYHAAQLRRFADGELSAADIARTEGATNQQAAWTMVARALMNLDEVITKQ